MGRWFRFYDDAINDPKILKLPEASRWHWTALLCIASKNEGVLPPIEDVALMLRVKSAAAAAIIAQMKAAGLLDLEDGKYAPHNWSGRQYKSDVSTERVKRFRKRERNVSETPPDTEADTDTEKTEKLRAIALSSGPSEFELFWAQWPNKVGKPAAEKAFRSAIKRGATYDAISSGVVAYMRDKPADRPWLNPATFLNQNRWEDKPAPTGQQPAATNGTGAMLDPEEAVKHFAKTGRWSRWAGPEPGMAGCRASDELLALHGFLPDGRKIQGASP